ncbi:PKD-like family lipoprotein [Gabonibacter chumensis]|uniref:PKD-like family lipoprotein n=1 Tax=Gabonibacter chumensis TaxID=2972474 RepID=UPI0025740BD3|nr:PKD-like family lipoprotein [Gabonibacter chumensis]MCR9011930.1 PKD-like family lipoprotein [Gabonibacter chumensis]
MKKLKNGLFLLGILLLAWGCYDDKGSYDYHNINEVAIDLPASVGTRLLKNDSVLLELDPKLTQTQANDETNLTFKWEIKEPQGGWKLCGDEKACRIWLQPEDVSAFTVRLTLTDNSSDGTVWYKMVNVTPIPPYNRCWFVLQEVNGQSVLGAVDGMGEHAVVIPDVYETDMGKKLSLQGTPKALINNIKYGDAWGGYYSPAKPVVILMTDRDAVVLNSSTFAVEYTLEDMLYGKKLAGDTDFAPEFIYSKTQSAGEMIIDRGELYHATADGYSVYYPTVLTQGNKTDFRAKIACASDEYFVIYDELHHRFLGFDGGLSSSLADYDQYLRLSGSPNYYVSGYTFKLELIPEKEESVNLFDPNNIGDDKVMLDMGITAQRSDAYGKIVSILYSRTDHMLHVYEINADAVRDPKTPWCSGKFKVPLPAGVDYRDLCFTTSYLYDRLFFMAAENKIYKVDLNRVVPETSVIYEHSDPAVKIKRLKFRLNYYAHYVWNEDWLSYIAEGLPYLLGAALDYGGDQGGLVEMKLNASGDVLRGENSLEFKGFGKIVDIGSNIK